MASASHDGVPSSTSSRRKVAVLSKIHPGDIAWHADGEPIMEEDEIRNDGWDDFNHPRYRRLIILRELAERSDCGLFSFERVGGDGGAVVPKQDDGDGSNSSSNLNVYLKVHSPGLVDFLNTAWREWDGLGRSGQDPNSSLEHRRREKGQDGLDPSTAGNSTASSSSLPLPLSSSFSSTSALIPGNAPLPREAFQRPSRNVMGKMGYYCTDTCTPIFGGLLEELVSDMNIIQRSVEKAVTATTGADNVNDDDDGNSLPPPVVYALCSHPGHHSAHDSFGGYCYVNHAALAARLLQERLALANNTHNDNNNDDPTTPLPKVAILDVDYHAGNGTTSIFYDDPTVLVVSIHCHPDYDYPFHSGYDDEIGTGDGAGATLNVPLMPGTVWKSNYEDALQRAMQAIRDFGARALVVSLGLDTLKGDPCAIRRAGFELEGDDYVGMGKVIGRAIAAMEKNMSGKSGGNDDEKKETETSIPLQEHIPLIVVQEGGYRMDKVPEATANVLMGIVTTI